MSIACVVGSVLIATVAFLIGFPLGAFVGWGLSRMVMVDPREWSEADLDGAFETFNQSERKRGPAMKDGANSGERNVQ